MSFDFFNKQPSALAFSESETSFLNRLLPFLDPQNTKTINGRSAIELLNRANLPNPVIKDIWLVINPKQKESLSYEDVQSIIRLVAYGQNGIQITQENLQSNISCNAPVFDFDVANNSSPNKSIEEEILAFDKTWNSIQGKANELIAGTQVKKLYQTASNKKGLSKAWTLCNLSTKGYLTKGELFVFVYLIGLLQQNTELPNELTPQMKSIIAKIDSKHKALVASQKGNIRQPQVLDESARMLQLADKNEKRNIENLGGIADNQVKFQNLVAWVERFIGESEQNNANVQSEMEKIKTSQAQTFERLNGSIVKLQRVIQRQGTIIQQLMRELKSRNNTDQQRVRALEGVSEKSIEPSVMVQRAFQKKPSLDTSNRQPPPSEKSEVAENPLSQYQMQALNLLNQVRPITPEQLPSIQKRIMEMSQLELHAFYNTVVKKYQEQQQEQQQPQRQVSNRNSQVEPNSSNILGGIEINPGGLPGLDNSKVQRQNFEFATNVLENLQFSPEDVERGRQPYDKTVEDLFF